MCDRGEDHVNIAAFCVIPRAEERSAKLAGLVILTCNRLRDRRLAGPRNAVEPEDLTARIAFGS